MITFETKLQPVQKLLPKGDPAFCVIAPTAYLNEYAMKSWRHLVLAHLVDTDPNYAAFYRDRSAAGDFIIQDNGAYELGQSYDPEKLIDLGNKCGADAIVLPDYPGKPSMLTIDAAVQYAQRVKDAGFYTMFVPQSEVGEMEDWIDGYMWAADQENIDIIGMSILGIPNAMPHIPAAYARVVMTEILMDRGVFAGNKYHHYLGLQAAANVELPALLAVNALDSCDSSNPVWCGINGLRYNESQTDWMPVQKRYLREVDFNQHMTNKPHIHEAISHNLQLTLDLFGEVDE